MRSQRTRAVEALTKIRDAISDETILSLQDAVGEAQNGPPDGMGDGTIREREWATFRDATEHLLKFMRHAKEAIQ